MSSKPIALVTGGTRGIGLAIALELARSGFNVAVNGRRPESDVSDALGAIEGEGAQAAYVRGDIGDDDSRSAILEAIRERFGRLDTLVNNAGVAPDVRADITEMSEASYDRVMGINLRGPFFLTQAVARWMLEQRQTDNSFRGSIINVSSVSATVVSINRGEYCISKAGIAMATQLWAARLSEYGIGVFELRPGVIETDMTSGVKEKYDALFEQGLTVERRWGKPEDVGRADAMLARGELTYATGQVITIDGGLTLPRL